MRRGEANVNPLATRGCRGSISSLFLDIDIAADDFGHIGVFFLGFSDERGIVEALVFGLDLILCFGRPAWLLLTLRFRVGIFQGTNWSSWVSATTGSTSRTGGRAASARARELTCTASNTVPHFGQAIGA